MNKKFDLVFSLSLLMIWFLVLTGCKEERNYSTFDCFESPLNENLLTPGPLRMYESVRVSLYEDSISSSAEKVLNLVLENTTDFKIWFPPGLNLIIWKEISENNWREIENLVSSETNNSMVLGPSGTNDSTAVIPVQFIVPNSDLPVNMRITFWGYRNVHNTYCEDHHGGIFRFAIDSRFEVIDLDDK